MTSKGDRHHHSHSHNHGPTHSHHGGAASATTTNTGRDATVPSTNAPLILEVLTASVIDRYRDTYQRPLFRAWAHSEAHYARVSQNTIGIASTPWSPSPHYLTSDRVAAQSEACHALFICVLANYSTLSFEGSYDGAQDGDGGGRSPVLRQEDRLEIVCKLGIGAGGAPTSQQQITIPVQWGMDTDDPLAKVMCWRLPRSLAENQGRCAERLRECLKAQYEKVSPFISGANVRCLVEADVPDLKDHFISLRRASEAAKGKVLFHYLGHGLPLPQSNIFWVAGPKHVYPLPIEDLLHMLGFPTILIFDCGSAGTVLKAAIEAFKRAVEAQLRFRNPRFSMGSSSIGLDDLNPATPITSHSPMFGGGPSGSSSYLPAHGHASHHTGRLAEGLNSMADAENRKDFYFFGACDVGEQLPVHSLLPSDLFTTCLTTPLKMAVLWFIVQNRAYIDLHPLVVHLLSLTEDKAGPIQELTKVFNALTDCLAWSLLSPLDFGRLMRQDCVLAAVMRGYLLADRIFSVLGVNTVSFPPISHEHVNSPLWDAWDGAVGSVLDAYQRTMRLPSTSDLTGSELRTYLDERLALGRPEAQPWKYIDIIFSPLDAPMLTRGPFALQQAIRPNGPSAANGGVSVQAAGRFQQQRTLTAAALISSSNSVPQQRIKAPQPPIPFFQNELISLHAWVDSLERTMDRYYIDRLPVLFHTFLLLPYRAESLHLLCRLADRGAWAVAQMLPFQLFSHGPNRYVMKEKDTLATMVDPASVVIRELLLFLYARSLQVDCTIVTGPSAMSIATVAIAMLKQPLPREDVSAAGGLLGTYSTPFGQRLLVTSILLSLLKHNTDYASGTVGSGGQPQPMIPNNPSAAAARALCVKEKVLAECATLLPTAAIALEGADLYPAGETLMLLIESLCGIICALIPSCTPPPAPADSHNVSIASVGSEGAASPVSADEDTLRLVVSSVKPLLFFTPSRVRFAAWLVLLVLCSCEQLCSEQVLRMCSVWAIEYLALEGSAELRAVIIGLLFQCFHAQRRSIVHVSKESITAHMAPGFGEAYGSGAGSNQTGSPSTRQQRLLSNNIMSSGNTSSTTTAMLIKGLASFRGGDGHHALEGPLMAGLDGSMLESVGASFSEGAALRQLRSNAGKGSASAYGAALPPSGRPASSPSSMSTPPSINPQPDRDLQSPPLQGGLANTGNGGGEGYLPSSSDCLLGILYSLAVASNSSCCLTRGHATKAISEISLMVPCVPSLVAEKCKRVTAASLQAQQGAYAGSVGSRKEGGFFSFFSVKRTTMAVSGDPYASAVSANIDTAASEDTMRHDLRDIRLFTVINPLGNVPPVAVEPPGTVTPLAVTSVATDGALFGGQDRPNVRGNTGNNGLPLGAGARPPPATTTSNQAANTNRVTVVAIEAPSIQEATLSINAIIETTLEYLSTPVLVEPEDLDAHHPSNIEAIKGVEAFCTTAIEAVERTLITTIGQIVLSPAVAPTHTIPILGGGAGGALIDNLFASTSVRPFGSEPAAANTSNPLSGEASITMPSATPYHGNPASSVIGMPFGLDFDDSPAAASKGPASAAERRKPVKLSLCEHRQGLPSGGGAKKLLFVPHNMNLVSVLNDNTIIVYGNDRAGGGGGIGAEKGGSYTQAPHSVLSIFQVGSVGSQPSPLFADTNNYNGATPPVLLPAALGATSNLNGSVMRGSVSMPGANASVANMTQLGGGAGALQHNVARKMLFGGGGTEDICGLHIVDPTHAPALLVVGSKGGATLLRDFDDSARTRRVTSFNSLGHEETQALLATRSAYHARRYSFLSASDSTIAVWDLLEEMMVDSRPIGGLPDCVATHSHLTSSFQGLCNSPSPFSANVNNALGGGAPTISSVGSDALFAAAMPGGIVQVYDLRMGSPPVITLEVAGPSTTRGGLGVNGRSATATGSSAYSPSVVSASPPPSNSSLMGTLRLLDLQFSSVADAFIGAALNTGEWVLWDLRAARTGSGLGSLLTAPSHHHPHSMSFGPELRSVAAKDWATAAALHPLYYQTMVVLWGNAQKGRIEIANTQTFIPPPKESKSQSSVLATCWHPYAMVGAISDMSRTYIVEVPSPVESAAAAVGDITA